MPIENAATKRNTSLRESSGFSQVQLIIVVATIGIITALGFLDINRARASTKLSGSTRELAAYSKKARGDAIRRHDVAIVQTPANGGTSYTVQMDFDGDGVLDAARTFNLADGVSFNGNAQTIAFNWRGLTNGEVAIGLQYDAALSSTINITGSGEVSVDSDRFRDADVPSVALSNSNVAGDVITDRAVGSPASTPTPTP